MFPSNLKFEQSIVCCEEQQTAIACLSSNVEQISKAKLKNAMKYGAVWLERNGKVRRLRKNKAQLNFGDKLYLYYDESILESVPNAAILIKDLGDYSVWNKPSGMFSQGTKWGDHNSICRWVELYGFKERQSYLVHRLDRATSGLILVAHTKKACKLLTNLFEKRKIEKRYRAVVAGSFVDSINEIISPVNEKEAITKILENKFEAETNRSHLLLKIETGRKHQIRKHLSSQGYPIIGDRLYGESNEGQEDLQLRSCFIRFDCPITGSVQTFLL